MWLTLDPHPLHPGWRSLDVETIGFWDENMNEAATMWAPMTFCKYHPLNVLTRPIGLFPSIQGDDPMWGDIMDHAKDTWALHPK